MILFASCTPRFAKTACFGYDRGVFQVIMEIKICQDREVWNQYFLDRKQAEFLQSWQWGEFQETVGRKAVRLQLGEGEKILAQFQGFVHKIGRLAKFIYFPGFYYPDILSPDGLSDWLSWLKMSGYMFARMEPARPVAKADNFHYVKTASRQPQHTLRLKVTSDETALLAAMHAKTRYNIGLAEKKGVEIKNEKEIEVFWELNRATAARDKFKSHSREYYDKMLALEGVYQLSAYFAGRPIAAAILISFGETLTYLHGVSANQDRNLMAPYLLQWRAIELARKLGKEYYDFGGVARLYRKDGVKTEPKETCFNGFCWPAAHKWTGLTRFKVGFGGEPRARPEAFEVPFKNNLYRIFNLVKKFI